VLVAVCVIHVVSLLLMWMRVEPFYTFQVPIAAWSFVMIIALWNRDFASNSPTMQDRWSILRIAALSILFWLLFELFNLRLGNWQYIGIPVERTIRWVAYLVSFSAVLPAVLEISTFLKNIGLGRGFEAARRIHPSRGLLIRFMLLGLLAVAAGMLSPGILFPLVWVGPIFILDPIVYIWGRKEHSLIGNLSRGRPSLWIRLSLTGLIFGFLCQFWSYWAGAKWLYSVPGYEFFPVLELPVAGYLIFPFLAMNFYLFDQLCRLAMERGLFRSRARKILLGLTLFMFVEGVIWGIDQWTVLTFRIVLSE